MHALSVRFKLPNDTNWNELRQLMKDRAKLYANVPGLKSKAFVLNPETCEYGGNYVWEGPEDIDSFLKSELYLGAVKKLGEPAEVRRFDVPAYVDKGVVTE